MLITSASFGKNITQPNTEEEVRRTKIMTEKRIEIMVEQTLQIMIE